MNRPKMEIWKIGMLQPYDKNARVHTEEQVAKIAASIQQFGWTIPILISKEGEVIAGHGRLMAAESLGMTTVPVLVEDYLTETQRKAYRLADNKLTEIGDWDQTLLATEVQHLMDTEIPIDDIGFTKEEIEKMLAPEPEPAEPEMREPPRDVVAQEGEIWILGKHRLICGDATDPKVIERLMNGERAELFATDPPYGVKYEGRNRMQKSDRRGWGGDLAIDADKQSAILLHEDFIQAAIEHALKDNAAFYLWHADTNRNEIEQVWSDAGIDLHQVIIWDKQKPVLGRTDFYWQHETCLYGWRKGHKPRFAKQKKDNTSVWSIEGIKPSDRPDHPTPKPPELFGIPMRKHTKLEGICFEPFCGSGSQIIAGEENGRRVFACEINPIYIEVAIRRWEAATEQQATREDGKTLASLKKIAHS